jgi:butyrate kinase
VREQGVKVEASGPFEPDLVERLALSTEPALQHSFEWIVHRIAGEVGKMFVTAGCDVETIVLSGKLLESESLKVSLRHSVGRLAPMLVLKENLARDALASRAVAILSGRMKPLSLPLVKAQSPKEKEK